MFVIEECPGFAAGPGFSATANGERVFGCREFHDRAAAVRELVETLAARGVYIKPSEVRFERSPTLG